MLFNSFIYILLFLPTVALLYYTFAKYVSYSSAKKILVLASLFFYGWWNPTYLILLIVSIIANYQIAKSIQKQIITSPHRKNILILGILFNLGLLTYFKYTNFFIANINTVLHTHVMLKEIILPLGISFFTFTQIAFLIDTHRNTAKEYGVLNYFLFVTFFPHLLAGPIIHHAQMMPQFANETNAKVNYANIYFGLILFIIGLAKKLLIADTFAIFANNGFSSTAHLDFTSAWITSLSYTLQIYFDFSGYTDMAIGASKLFNINLPINFNSPYQSLNIQEFWRRWHITLSNFLRDYLYIPLGGNRVVEINIYRNLFLTFILGGLWHGAGWTFVIWGFLHGAALSIQRWFGNQNIILPRWFSWFLTFNFINITWIFFRADSVNQAMKIISAMLNFSNVAIINPILAALLLITLLIVITLPNSSKIIEKSFVRKLSFLPAISMLMVFSIISMEIANNHAFIYFQF